MEEKSDTSCGIRAQITCSRLHPQTFPSSFGMVWDRVLHINIFLVSAGKECNTLTGHTEVIHSMTYSWDGALLATSCKDKKLRIYDLRSNKVAQEAAGHAGIKGSRAVWMV